MRLSKLIALVVVLGSAAVASMGTVACGDGGTGGTGAGDTGPECVVDCAANKDIESDCVAIVDNADQTDFGLRMSQLTIKKPEKLTAAKNPIVVGLIDSGVTLNLGKECNLTGQGTFSWLLQFDTAAGTLKTGGAALTPSPADGYCFVNAMLGTTPVAPITVDAKPDASGKFSVTKGGDVVVPIFLTSETDYVLLPLSDAKIIDATLSADNNCIGKYNSDTLKTADLCQPAGEVTRYTNAASISGYITLEDADTVIIESLKRTMCVLLTDSTDSGMPTAKCKRDANGKIEATGDWCSTTNSAGGCNDSFELGADFAASAVKITGDCK